MQLQPVKDVEEQVLGEVPLAQHPHGALAQDRALRDIPPPDQEPVDERIEPETPRTANPANVW